MSEVDDLKAEVARLKEQIADERATLKAWFETKSLAKSQMEPEFVNAVKGYLRTSRSGGMPQKQSNLVEAVLEDFARLYLANTMWPIMLRIAEEKRGELKVPEGLAPRNGMTDQKIYDSITRHLEKMPKMPKNVIDMDDHDREFFEVISYQSGMMLFLQHTIAERIRTA